MAANESTVDDDDEDDNDNDEATCVSSHTELDNGDKEVDIGEPFVDEDDEHDEDDDDDVGDEE